MPVPCKCADVGRSFCRKGFYAGPAIMPGGLASPYRGGEVGGAGILLLNEASACLRLFFAESCGSFGGGGGGTVPEVAIYIY